VSCTTTPAATAFIQQCLDNGDKRSDIVEALDAHFGVKKTKAYELIKQVAKDAPVVSHGTGDRLALLPLVEDAIRKLFEQEELAEARKYIELAARMRGLTI
jgi:FAD synthase